MSQSTQYALKRIEMKKNLFTPLTHYALSAKFTKTFVKKSVSQSTQNALKRIEMQKEFLPLMSGFSHCRRTLKF